jgi:hypothetical protein
MTITKVGFVVFVAVAGIALGQVIKEPIRKLTRYPSDPFSTPSKPTPSLSPVAVPPTGVLENYSKASSKGEPLRRLSIYSAPPKTQDDSPFSTKCQISDLNPAIDNQHYFVRVSDWKSNQMALTAFIRAGETLELELPLKHYRVRYAIGVQWYGEQHLFGEATRYIQLMDIDNPKQPLKLDLSQRNWHVALFPCGPEGTMKQEPINPDDF